MSHSGTRPRPRPTSSGGVFSHGNTEFTYTTPTGGQAVIQVVGLGNLAGTTVDRAACSIWSSAGPTRTRRSSSHVKGGEWPRPLASILNSQLIAAVRPNSFSGVGGNVIQSVYLQKFDLIAGGDINLTAGRELHWCSTRSVPTRKSTSAHFPPPRVRRRARRRQPRSWSCRRKASTARARSRP